jgi:hypothetical protein
VALGAAAQAQTRQRTFVSPAGSDANDCSEVSPCRNWQAAIDNTITGGEVAARDSADYGPINLTRSMTITGEGVHAVSPAAAAGNAVTINVPGGTVILRHLYVQNNTSGTGLNGVNATDFGALHIESVTANGFAGADAAGINVVPTAPAAREVFVKDSILRNNTSGLKIVGNGATTATVQRTRAENNNANPAGTGGNGFGFLNQLKVTLESCDASGNTNGFLLFSASLPAEMNIERGVASNNSFSGIAVGGVAATVVRVSNSVVTNNFVGLVSFGGTLQSRVNNTVAGNTGSNSPAVPIPGL